MVNRNAEVVGLIFDGNEEAMAGDWTYSETAGRALSTDIRFALTIAPTVMRSQEHALMLATDRRTFFHYTPRPAK